MTVNVSVGHKVDCSIIYLDQNGNPMLTPVTPDSPPNWSNAVPTVDSLVAAQNGLTCELTALSSGADTVNLSLAVGGKVFTALLQISVQGVPQVLTSIAIGATVS